MKPRIGLLALTVAVTVLASFSSMAGANPASFVAGRSGATLGPSGSVEYRDQSLGTTLTECPQAGKVDSEPQPLGRLSKDEVERASGGSDRRLNQDYSCFPQNETSITINPAAPRNIVGWRKRLPAGHGLVGLLRLDRQGRELVRRDHPVPVDAGDGRQRKRLSAERRRSRHRIRPGGNRLLRADRLQPLQRHQRRLRPALDERRLHVVAGVRPDQRAEPGRRRCRVRQPRRSAPARRRDSCLQRRQRHVGERQRPVQRQGVDDRRAAAGRRHADVLRSRDPDAEGRAIPQ